MDRAAARIADKIALKAGGETFVSLRMKRGLPSPNWQPPQDCLNPICPASKTANNPCKIRLYKIGKRIRRFPAWSSRSVRTAVRIYGAGMIHLNVHYCDEIIRHAENDKYSLIGIFPIYAIFRHRIPFYTACACLFHFPPKAWIYRLWKPVKFFLEIVRNDDVISALEIPSYDGSDTEENVSFMLHQTISGLPVSDNDRIYVRMTTHNHILSESRPLSFSWLPYHS